MRIRLRPPESGDAEAIYRAMQDPGTIGWLPNLPMPYLRADAEGFLQAAAGGPDRVIEADGAFAGMIRTGPDLGYWLARECRGRGIMLRAAQVALVTYFAGAGETVTASHLVDNLASRRVLRRLGFRDIGPEPIPGRGGGEGLPGRAMELNANDFSAALAIRTQRCCIDRLTDADLPEMHRIFTAPDTARMLLRFQVGMPFGDLAAMIRPIMDPLRRRMRMAIRREGRLIGSIGVHDGDAPSIYYALAPEVAGQGLGSEIVPVFCDTVQDWFGLETLKAEVFQDNPASRRILEKAGFVVTGEDSVNSLGRDGPAPGWLMQRG
ncbi:GNAT family N-acetyltransferase [Paracoccus xiamenensis]|uniref:GNAT family N-acetyltransferase n=1 Tax=Paracoccus xiamenensis TaxID=2714901 RepID=UPI00140B1353|nr:GNAT family N-acetyltransferase [Paracoccus xiamenensis]NHF72742.1 GNAT N-acetyltransferase [Paracoccus xiamenensis]